MKKAWNHPGHLLLPHSHAWNQSPSYFIFTRCWEFLVLCWSQFVPIKFPRVLSKFSQVPEFWNVFPTIMYNFMYRVLQLPKCGWDILYLQCSVNKFVTYPCTMGMPKTINIQTTDLEYTCLNSPYMCLRMMSPGLVKKFHKIYITKSRPCLLEPTFSLSKSSSNSK